MNTKERYNAFFSPDDNSIMFLFQLNENKLGSHMDRLFTDSVIKSPFLLQIENYCLLEMTANQVYQFNGKTVFS